MAFMRRFDPSWMSLAERIAAGEIGEPLLVRSTGRGPGLPPEWALDPETSGGLIAEVNSHDLDSIRWFSGQEFETVYAVGRAAKRPDLVERFPGFVDVVLATFELSGGALRSWTALAPPITGTTRGSRCTAAKEWPSRAILGAGPCSSSAAEKRSPSRCAAGAISSPTHTGPRTPTWRPSPAARPNRGRVPTMAFARSRP